MEFLPMEMKNLMANETWRFFQQLLLMHVSAEIGELSINDFHQVDYALLAKLINEHRLELILYPVLKNFILDENLFLDKLKKLRQHYVFNHLSQKKVLIELNEYFKQRNIPFILFKGLALNQLLYGKQCLRRSVDIDILINPLDLLPAHLSLLDLGFQLIPELHMQIIFDLLISRKVLFKYFKDLVYIHPQKKIIIELHWQLTKIGNLGLDWKQLSQELPVKISGYQVTVLSNEVNFIYLCVHAASHQWRRLQWLTDLAVFYKTVPLDWEEICVIARKSYCVRALYEAKILLKEWFGMELKTPTVSLVDRMFCAWRLYDIRKAQQALLDYGECDSFFLGTYKSVFFRMLLLPKLWQKKLTVLSISLNRILSLKQLNRYPNRPLVVIAFITFCKNMLSK